MTRKIGLIIKMPIEQCSDKERDYMRVRYIAKLLEWKRAELEQKSNKRAV